MLNTNFIMLCDSYKFCHHKMYPKDLERVYSYFEARDGAKYDKVVFVGLQQMLMDYFAGRRVTTRDIDNADRFCKCHFGSDKVFNRPMWENIVNCHNGKLPIRISAVPEGQVVGVNNVMLTVENTGGAITAPLTNHCETLLSQLWYPCTVATYSREIKKTCKEYLELTGGDMGALEFMNHDFGYRGVSSVESAGIGDMAHLVMFLGTDTVRGWEYAEHYYNANPATLAFGVSASEHSVMTAKGKDGEEEIFLQILNEYPEGIVSVVIDSYNDLDFIQMTGKHKDLILGRKGKVVFRPDSGEPVKTTLEVLERLRTEFGVADTKGNFCKLPDQVGALWGDGIDHNGIGAILYAMFMDKWRADNIVFGQGGALLQRHDRDEQRFAFKCSAQRRDGIWHDIRKDPRQGGKSSKAGRLALIEKTGMYRTLRQEDWTSELGPNLLETVFENGEILRTTTFEDIRKRAAL